MTKCSIHEFEISSSMDPGTKRKRYSSVVMAPEGLRVIYDSLKLSDLGTEMANGKLISFILFETSTEVERSQKKEMLSDILIQFLDEELVLPVEIQDSMISLYDSVEDLKLLALAKLIIKDFRMPKSVQGEIVTLIQSSDTGVAADDLRLLASSVAIERAAAAIPRELSKLILFSCGSLVKGPSDLLLPALVCLRAYLKYYDNLSLDLPSDLLTRREVVEKFCQKILKHRPEPLSRECVSFLKVTASSSDADLVRELLSADDRLLRSFQATAVKFPNEIFAIFSNIFNVTPLDGIPVEKLKAIAHTVISSCGSSEVLVTIIRFALSCAETEAILRAMFRADSEDEIESGSVVLLTEMFLAMRDGNDASIVWPAVALSFLGNAIVKESLADGQLEQNIDSALNLGDEACRTAAILLLCPILPRRLKLGRAHNSRSHVQNDCVKCSSMESRMRAYRAGQDAMAERLVELQSKINDQNNGLSGMRKALDDSNTLANQRNCESKSLQMQIIVKEKTIRDMKASLESFQTEAQDQRIKNQETLTALKQARRENEKLKSDLERKRSENQQTQRELGQAKEQLSTCRKKIDELESLKEKLSALLGPILK